MTSFALVLNNQIIQIDPEQFPVASGLSWTTDISAISPAPQVGWTAQEAAGVWSFTAPAAPTVAQQAQALLAAGACQIASTGTPAIDGTYAIDANSRAMLGEIIAGINAGDGLPGGGASFIYDDAQGAHSFTEGSQVLAVGKGLRDFIYAAMQVVQGRAEALPAQPWPIP